MPTSPDRKIRVVLAEDHTLVRQGFRRILEDSSGIEVVGEASTGLAAIELSKKLKPDVVVMDLAMPELGGLEATEEILKVLPETKILILSMYSNDAYMRKAFKLGARGYVLKNAIEVDLTRAVRALADGDTYMSPGISNVLIENLKGHGPGEVAGDAYDRLTLREDARPSRPRHGDPRNPPHRRIGPLRGQERLDSIILSFACPATWGNHPPPRPGLERIPPVGLHFLRHVSGVE